MAARICVVVNKWWELDPVLGVLLHDLARPKSLGWPKLVRHPRPRPDQARLPNEDQNPSARAIFSLTRSSVEIWCISDLLEHLRDESTFQSSSERKAQQLPRIFRGATPALTLAVGTAASIGPESANGCVVVGTRAFMHNSHPDGSNQHSNWSAGPFDTIVDSSINSDFFLKATRVESQFSQLVSRRLLRMPLNSSRQPMIMADYDAVALSNINVTDAREFETTDPDTIKAFRRTNTQHPAGSIETTHGLIRALGGSAFLFVSGIANRVSHFNDEVAPRSYAQNGAAAHNAGVVLAWLLASIDPLL